MKYRKLGIGEVIQEGDEVKGSLEGGAWGKVTTPGIQVYLEDVFRRPLTPEETANIFRQKFADLMEECGVKGIGKDQAENFYFNISKGKTRCYLDLGYATPDGIRESITSPETGATE